ncbi:MAG: rod shape-determining protein MreD [Gammaproteobacteria bacterium]|nr:rod shape-determining protein MreD [Gammaproteobacteria bacterium]
MNYQAKGGGWIIVLSFLAALALTILPLPGWIAAIRPEWAVLVLIYWCMALPGRVGVGWAWVVGLLLDVLRGGLLGQHALSFALVAYVTLHLHQRIRVFPLWQQAVSVLILVLLHLLLQLWIKGISGNPPPAMSFLLPALSSMLLWPLMFLGLRRLRRRFRVT